MGGIIPLIVLGLAVVAIRGFRAAGYSGVADYGPAVFAGAVGSYLLLATPDKSAGIGFLGLAVVVVVVATMRRRGILGLT